MQDPGTAISGRSSAGSAVARRIVPVAWAVGGLIATIAAYLWIIPLNQVGQWRNFSFYDASQSQSFLSGTTELLPPPSPELLRLPDPYDPASNLYCRLNDASLYHGHFYLYFGPVPALLEMPVFKWVIRERKFPVGDQYPTFAFLVAMSVAAGAIFVRARRIWFASAPNWSIAVGLIVTSLCAPVLWLLSRAAVYEAAIAGGQCFVLFGLYFAFVGSTTNRSDSWLFLSGVCWAAAVGCRWSLAPAIIFAAALTVIYSKCWRARAAILLPLALGASLLGFYNHARFGFWTETGWVYQLAALNNHALAGTGVVISPRYVLPNLFAYLFQLPAISSSDPYLTCQNGVHGLTRLFPRPFLHPLDYTTGLAWSMPFLLFSWETLRWLRQRPNAGVWFGLTLLTFGIISPIPALFSIYTTERYLADAAPALAMFAVLGSLHLMDRTADSPSRYRAAIAIILVLAAITARIGLALATRKPDSLSAIF